MTGPELPPVQTRDIVILVCSRGREKVLSRLIDDLASAFIPALEGGGFTATAVVYAQVYPAGYLAGLAARHAAAIAAGKLAIAAATRMHSRIGDVVATAIETMNARYSWRLCMLIDDDSLFTPDAAVEENLCRAVRLFLDGGYRSFSIKLGQGREFAVGPFIDPQGPIAPFKEKMIWASPAVLDEALALPGFRDLSIAEDTVITALAWRKAPELCRAVHGIASFVHFGAEAAPGVDGGDIGGGYADLVGFTGPPTEAAPHGKYDAALREGVTHWHVMPDVFVGPEHPHFIYAGIRSDLARRLHGPDQAGL
jgi:hypothetical protein